MLKLAYQYMRYYKNQTFAILASMILTAALLSGISSLMYSSQRNDLENNKTIYGDWHYNIEANQQFCESVQQKETGNGYDLVQVGKKEIRDVLREPYLISFVYADVPYMQMTHRELTKGRYPQKEGEIAADHYTLGNLGFTGGIGDGVSLGGEDYILTGIVNGKWSSDADEMEVFVGEGFAGRGRQMCLYLRFAENQKLYRQLDAFCRKYGISGDAVEGNEHVIQDLGGEQPDSIYEIVKFALTDERGNFTYVLLKLTNEYRLDFYGMITLLCLFSLFVIYSIFQISISKRTSEYGIMQTLGISEKRIAGILIMELWILFFVGYPIGCLLGNGILNICYQQLANIFGTRSFGTAKTGTELSKTDQVFAQSQAESPGFYVAWKVMIIGFFVLMTALAIIGFITVYAMHRRSVRQIMAGDTSYIKRKRYIYARRNGDLASVVVRKFMFSNKRKVIGILLSLSIGGCIFLCTAYMAENLKIHADMLMKSEDGLGSQYKISVKSNALSDTIPKSVVEQIRNMPELSMVYASKYTLGELIIQKNELEWVEYFKEQNQDSYFNQRYGGICVEKENGTYGIKYDVYGYEEGMVTQLEEFLLEGRIRMEELENQDKIVAVANKDGQGNYNFYGKHPGDTIRLRVPKDQDCPDENLKFQGPEDCYIEKEFQIAAIVSRALAKEEQFLNVQGWSNSQSIIMTNQQMERQYNIADYSFINASPAEGNDTGTVTNLLLQKIKDIPKTVLKDLSGAIETQKHYLRQQQLFFSGIAGILFVISLFHIMNSVNYSILSRRREYGMIRAMGITDIGFYRMVLQAGMTYGLLTDLFLFLIYNIVLRKMMDYYMVHIVQFLHFTAEVPTSIMAMVMSLNLLAAEAAVLIPARKIVKENIISEIAGER